MKKLITVAAVACLILFASFALQAQQRGQRGQRGEQPPAAPAQPGQPPAAPAGPAPKPLVPVAASTLAAHPETYYGERVTMTGAIEQTLGKLAFSVDQDKAKTLDQQIRMPPYLLTDDGTKVAYIVADPKREGVYVADKVP